MTDFRAKGTIIGLTGLTAVFGMGTGGTPPVWSPEIHPAGGQARRVRISVVSVTPGRVETQPAGKMIDQGLSDVVISKTSRISHERLDGPIGLKLSHMGTITASIESGNGIHRDSVRMGCGIRVGVVKRSAVGTGPLRWSPTVHSQPIDLVVFQEPSHIKCWKPRLEEGFALRCLQRLSFPDLATRRCP